MEVFILGFRNYSNRFDKPEEVRWNLTHLQCLAYVNFKEKSFFKFLTLVSQESQLIKLTQVFQYRFQYIFNNLISYWFTLLVCVSQTFLSLLEISELFLKEAKHCECLRFHLTSSGLSNLFEYSLKPRINSTST